MLHFGTYPMDYVGISGMVETAIFYVKVKEMFDIFTMGNRIRADVRGKFFQKIIKGEAVMMTLLPNEKGPY